MEKWIVAVLLWSITGAYTFAQAADVKLPPLPVQNQKINPVKPLPAITPPPPPSQGTLQITAPSAGHYQVQGNYVDIAWSKQGTITDNCYNLVLKQGAIPVRQIQGHVCTNGFRWQVPNDLSGGDFRIHLSTTDNTVQTTSAPFPIINRKATLVVNEFHIDPEVPNVADNQNVVLKLKFSNSGFAKSLPTELSIRFKSSDTGKEAITFFSLRALAFGDHDTMTKKITLPVEGKWTYVMTIGPISSNEIYQWAVPREGEYTTSYLPDLIVCIYEEVDVKPLHYAYINVDVRNRGKATAAASELEFWIEGKGTQKIAMSPIPANPKSPWTQYRYEMWGTPGESSYRVSINKNKKVPESDFNNNELTGNIYRYYNLEHGKQIRYRCTSNCHMLECKQ
jgi:hypothetical protein